MFLENLCDYVTGDNDNMDVVKNGMYTILSPPYIIMNVLNFLELSEELNKLME